jgi:signal transduction histidine kinase/ActR/RegA family two-component response regulator
LLENTAIASDGAIGPAQRFSVERRQALRRLQFISQLAWVLPALSFVIIAAALYRQHFTEAQQAIDRASRIAQEHALKLFETNSMLLQRMLDLWGDASDEEVMARGLEFHERLKRMAADLPQVQGLFINGADARGLANSLVYPPPRHIDYSDRESVRAHRSGDVGVFITEQLRSRISGEPFFDMSRRRSRSDGSYGGSAHVSLKPDYLTNFYAELAKSERGLRFGVLREDGKMLVRWPDESRGTPNAENVNWVRAADGVVMYEDESPNRVQRLQVFRQLAPYPLYVVASVDVADVQAVWLRQIGWLALIAIPTTLLLTWMARVAVLRTRNELDAAQKLDDETALRQRMEVALLQSQKLEALGRLTGGVAHDFNNLLMIINNNMYVHRHLHPSICDSAQLAAIERAIAAGTKLTRQLLSFSKRQALLPERVDLRERLPSLLELLTPVLGKSIELDARVDSDLPPIKVDPAEFELALINLAVNAKDAMPQGGRLSVVARVSDEADPGRPRDDGPRYVLLEVTDTGSGIAPENLDRVFEPFFTTKPIGQGTGLGLSQVQALCQATGGMAHIESRLGGGTCVRLYFPAVDGDASAASAPAVPTPQQLNHHLLLVEDNEAVAKASRDVLESMGCTVEHVTTGEAALARIAERDASFAIVLSDIEMPGALDGIALAEQIIERYPQLPVLLMTGYAERLQQAQQHHFDVLPKPVDPRMLADAIAKALTKARSLSAQSF